MTRLLEGVCFLLGFVIGIVRAARGDVPLFADEAFEDEPVEVEEYEERTCTGCALPRADRGPALWCPFLEGHVIHPVYDAQDCPAYRASDEEHARAT